MKVMRCLKFSLELARFPKRQKLEELWIVYQKAVTDFLDRLFNRQDLSEDYIKNYQSLLSYAYKQCAKRQAFKIFKCWCRNKKKGKKPKLKNSMTLDYRFVELQKSKSKTFDYWVKIATLEKRKPILIPIKSYDYANQYFKDWELIKGGRLWKRNDKLFIIFTFQKEILLKNINKTIGIDIGYRKLLVTSEGKIVGERIKSLTEKAIKKEQGSKASKRVRNEIENYIGSCVKQVVDGNANIVLENLKNLKKNKCGKWSREVNRKFNFWLYGLVLKRLLNRAETLGVRSYLVEPQYTSQICPVCGYISELNRKGELFKCQLCQFSADADYVGSLNILQRFTHQPTVGVVSS